MLSLYDIVHLQQCESIDIESNLRLYIMEAKIISYIFYINTEDSMAVRSLTSFPDTIF